MAAQAQGPNKCPRFLKREELLQARCLISRAKPVAHAHPAFIGVRDAGLGGNVRGAEPFFWQLPFAKLSPLRFATQSK